MSEPEYVTIEYAGQVPVVAGQGKRLVRLDDVRRLAEVTGHRPANLQMTGTSVGHATGHVADDVVDTTRRPRCLMRPELNSRQSVTNGYNP